MKSERIELSEREAEIIRRSIETGEFQDTGEVVRAGIQLLGEHQEEYRDKLQLLKAEIQKGLDDVEAGRVIELRTPEDSHALFEEIKRRGRERLAEDTDAAPGTSH